MGRFVCCHYHSSGRGCHGFCLDNQGCSATESVRCAFTSIESSIAARELAGLASATTTDERDLGTQHDRPGATGGSVRQSCVHGPRSPRRPCRASVTLRRDVIGACWRGAGVGAGRSTRIGFGGLRMDSVHRCSRLQRQTELLWSYIDCRLWGVSRIQR